MQPYRAKDRLDDISPIQGQADKGGVIVYEIRNDIGVVSHVGATALYFGTSCFHVGEEELIGTSPSRRVPPRWSRGNVDVGDTELVAHVSHVG